MIDEVENRVREVHLVSIVVIDGSMRFSKLDDSIPFVSMRTASLLGTARGTGAGGRSTRGESDRLTLIVVKHMCSRIKTSYQLYTLKRNQDSMRKCSFELFNEQGKTIKCGHK
jgi:hypothetical protein